MFAIREEQNGKHGEACENMLPLIGVLAAPCNQLAMKDRSG